MNNILQAETLELGKDISAVQLRYANSPRGTFLRLGMLGGHWVWYEATNNGFFIASDDDNAALEARYLELLREQRN